MNTAVLTEKAIAKNDWPLFESNGLTLIQSPLLAKETALVHAFTTRLGGNSPEPLNWFNLGRHWPTEDSRQDAMQNRARLCKALGLNSDKLTVPGQQHTTNIYVVNAATAEHTQRLPDLDGAATNEPGYPVLLHFADCVPVMTYDRKQKVICVMHAGWKGTAGGIVTKGVALLKDKWNSRPEDIIGAVGPAIGSCCYPTGDDVADKLAKTVRNPERLIHREDGQPRPDLKAINAMQLLEAGVCEVDVTAWCTACRPDIFYSHRQSGGKTGRQGAIACIR